MPGKVIRGTLVTIGVISSLVFLTFGASMALGDEVPVLMLGFGVFTLIYGVSSLVILIFAFCGNENTARKSMGVFGVVFVTVFFLSSFDNGILSGLEILGIVVVGIMVFSNWLAVDAAVKWRDVG